MTFDEYNTDDNFDKKESSLDELVKIGLKEGKTSDEIKSSLSPKWQKSKKINEFDSYVSKYSTPKEEPKAEEKTAPKVEEMTQTTEALDKEEPEEVNLTAPNLSKGDEKYIKDQRDRADNAEVRELNKINDRADYNYKKMYDSIARTSDAYKNIDDKLIAQLPIFMFRRYENGEFGDPKSEDAKLRLAYFAMNNVVSKLKSLANADAAYRGRGQIFADTESAYDKYQKTNLEQGLQNRWNKYKAETDNAIALASKETMSEQEARHAVEQLTRNQNMNTVWNTMNENQKLYAMEVTKKIGDYVGNMDISELGDFIAGAAYEGKMDKDKVIAIGIAKLAENSPEILNKLKDGEIKDMVFSFLPSVSAGIGGAGGKTNSNGDQTNLTGNLQNYESIDGSNISFDFSDPKANDKIKGELGKLKAKYMNGEIDAETFKKYYDPLYAEGKKHLGSIFTTPSSDKALSSANADVLTSLDEEFTNLNTQAKAGDLSPSAYQEQVAALTEKATKYGANKEMLKKIKDKTLSNEKILKAVDKKTKKK